MTESKQNNYKAVQRVLVYVLVANLLVTVTKITLGLITGALSVVADGFHSLVDSSSNLIGLAAIRLAGRPADERHPYGYARYETLGSLAIGGLLLAAAYEIASQVIERFRGSEPPNITPLTMVLVASTFIVNLAIVYLEKRAGRRLNSEILIADATHTQTDLFVTLSVIGSLIGIWFGVTWLDPIVAVFVVAMILRAAWEILRGTSGWLADASAIDPGEIETIATEVPGVWYVHRARSRGAPAAVFVDLHVKVYPGMSTDQSHGVASEVERRIKKAFPTVSDVVVHIEPGKIDPLAIQGASQSRQDWQRISYDLRQIADGMGLSIHEVNILTDPAGAYDLELHMEITGDPNLEEAHAQAEEYERRLRELWPQITRVTIHLEPVHPEVTEPQEMRDREAEQKVLGYLNEYFDPQKIVDVHSHAHEGYKSVAITIQMPAKVSLEEAHLQAEAIERGLMAKFHDLGRVTVHLEPETTIKNGIVEDKS